MKKTGASLRKRCHYYRDKKLNSIVKVIEAKKESKRTAPKSGPLGQLAELLIKGYPEEEAVKKIENDFGFYNHEWLEAAKKIQEKKIKEIREKEGKQDDGR